jgi:lysozyme
MLVSTKGRQLITQREGIRLTAYQDIVGVWTIGVGHTGRISRPYPHSGMMITKEQSDNFLENDLLPVENALNEYIKIPPNQDQFDAMASLAFNIGINGFIGSSVLKQFNQGHLPEAAEDFLMWDRPHELLGRRLSERAQFLGEV